MRDDAGLKWRDHNRRAAQRVRWHMFVFGFLFGLFVTGLAAMLANHIATQFERPLIGGFTDGH